MRGLRKDRAVTPFEALFCILALLGVVAIGYATGQASGVDRGRNEATTRTHYDGEKKTAAAACKGLTAAPALACISTAIDTARENSEARQGLYAQQDAARWSFWAMIGGWASLMIAAVGVWFVKRTLDATLEAVKEANFATEAAQRSVAETTRIGEAQSRAYLTVVQAEFYVDRAPRNHPGLPNFELILHFHNSGQTPAVNVSYYCTSLVAPWVDRSVLPPLGIIPHQDYVANVTPQTPSKVSATCFGIAVQWRDFLKRWKHVNNDTAFGQIPMLVIYGALFYEDIFGKTFLSRFAFSLEGCEAEDGMPVERSKLPTVQANIPTFVPIGDRLDYVKQDGNSF
jgi:hypothetical protein